MLCREPNLKGSHCHILKASIYLIIRFPISIRVSLEGLSFPISHHSPCHGGKGPSHACSYPFPTCLGVKRLNRTHQMEFQTYGDMSDHCFPLIYHLTGAMDSFYHAPYVITSCAGDLSPIATSMSPDHVKHDSLSLSDFAQYDRCGKTPFVSQSILPYPGLRQP